MTAEDNAIESLFDASWYSARFPDAEQAGMTPWDHYRRIGRLLDRPPHPSVLARRLPDEHSPRFDLDAYIACNPDVPRGDIRALAHRQRNKGDSTRLVSWLDRYLQMEFGPQTRLRVCALLDELLRGEASGPDATRRRVECLAGLKVRLERALSSRSCADSAPHVSVIVPVYNHVLYTLACAISVFESAPACRVELIIANDHSTDETRDVFSRFGAAVRVVQPEQNVGFVRNCNHAAREAEGEYVVMLNNDTVVLPSWLDAMIGVLARDERCGMVGSKLINLNGTLQEAGAIYWQDGSAWNFGRNQDPRSPQFRYLKEVDYCSGASICLRTETWRRVGGFDEHFTPAYCEEVDLAFRLREHHGLTTVYQPKSVLIHHEGVSHGKDVSVGIKAYQVENQRKLLERWRTALERDHFANGQSVFLARDRSRGKPRMLFVDHYVPTPDCDAGSRQMDAYLKLFAKMGYRITFWPDNHAYDAVNGPVYEQLGIEVISDAAGRIAFDEWVREHGAYLQAAFVSRPHIAVNYFGALKAHAPGCLRIFYGHDLHTERLRRELALTPAESLEKELALVAAWEKACWEQSDVITYPSQEECDSVASKCGSKRTAVLPLYCVPEEEARRQSTVSGFEDRRGLLFVGGFNHRPNTDAVVWFVREVLPLIRQKLPAVDFTIAGTNPPPEVTDLAKTDPHLRVTGRISDEALGALYEQSRVAVAPLRFGAGVKGKVVESLMKGLPMVTTSTGSQGLAGIGDGLSCADEPAAFASRIATLYNSREAWEHQRQEGQSYFAECFLEPRIRGRLSEWLPTAPGQPN